MEGGGIVFTCSNFAPRNAEPIKLRRTAFPSSVEAKTSLQANRPEAPSEPWSSTSSCDDGIAQSANGVSN